MPVAEISDHLQTDHPLLLLTLLIQTLSIVVTPHVARAVNRHLFQTECDEPHGFVQRRLREHLRKPENSGNAARIIISARRSVHGVIVGADHQDLFGMRLSRKFGDDIMVGPPPEEKRLPCHLIAERSEERRVGKESRSRWAPHHEKKKDTWR